MYDTKKRIIEAAEKLFFIQGIANVRLQQIADESGISVGNLAYHYKNKEAIVHAVYNKMFEEVPSVLSIYLKSPDLHDFELLFDSCHDFFTRNSFYLNNLWEINRSYEDIRQQWENFHNKMIAQIVKRIEFNMKRGALIAHISQKQVEEIAHSLWLTINYWISQQLLLSKKAPLADFKKVLWRQLYPYITEKGRTEILLKQPDR